MDESPSDRQCSGRTTVLPFRVGGGLTLSVSAENCAICAQVRRAAASTREAIGDDAGLIVVEAHCDGCATQQQYRYRVRCMPDSWCAIDLKVDGQWHAQALLSCDLQDQKIEIPPP